MTDQQFLIVDKTTFYRFAATAPENVRCEYVRGRIVQQMTGGTLKHANIGKRIANIIERQTGDQWIVLSGSDRGVETDRTIRYPDVVVEPVGAPENSLATKEPVIIVEVLSPSSEVRDLEAKPAEYTGIATLHAYVVASQDGPHCLIWLKRGDGTFATEPTTIEGRETAVEIASLGVTIPLAEVYRGIGEG
jgi:Uma2 family endonuclease